MLFRYCPWCSTKSSNNKMSTTIMMPQSLDSIRDMCTDAMIQAVAALAEKYNFDAEELIVTCHYLT